MTSKPSIIRKGCRRYSQRVVSGLPTELVLISDAERQNAEKKAVNLPSNRGLIFLSVAVRPWCSRRGRRCCNLSEESRTSEKY